MTLAEQVFRLPNHQRWARLLLVPLLGLAYIAVSASMIGFNKYLVHRGRFPFAVPLVFGHMGFGACFSALLYACRPSLFPSLNDPDRKIRIDGDLLMKGALPISILFSAQLVLSNTAYLHSTVAFLQMLKEANLVLVYSLSLAVALEHFNWRSARILFCVFIATVFTIHGEVHFSTEGFFIQGTSQLFESSKIVLSAMLLSGAGRKLDAFTYILLVTPLCFCVLGALLLVLVFVFPNDQFQTPQWADIVTWWPYLVANAFLSFALNLVIALFVKHSSAVSFILAGVTKDAMIVIVGAFVFQEVVTHMQAVGFTFQLLAILLYSMVKTFPEKFDDGILKGVRRVFSTDAIAVPSQQIDYGATQNATKAGEYSKREDGDAVA